METIQIISPLTKEIFHYRVDSEDTVSLIIDDLRGKGKPDNLFFYDGQEDVLLIPQATIDSLRTNINSTPLIISFGDQIADFQYLTLPENKILILLLKWDLSELIPIFVDSRETVGEVLKRLENSMDLLLSLKQIKDNVSEIVDREQNIGNLISSDQPSSALILIDDSQKLGELSDLELLPDELLLPTLMQLPVEDIMSFCQTSTKISRFCTEDLWNKLLERDFGVTQETLEDYWPALSAQKTAKESYRYIMVTPPSQYVDEAAAKGNLKLLKYGLFKGTLEFPQLVFAIHRALSTNQDEALRILVRHFVIRRFHLVSDYVQLLQSRPYRDQIKLVDLILENRNHFKSWGDYSLLLQSLLRVARMVKKEDMLKIVRASLEAGQTPNFYDIIREASHEFNDISKVQSIVEIMIDIGFDPDYNKILIIGAEEYATPVMRYALEHGAINDREAIIHAPDRVWARDVISEFRAQQ